MVSKFFSDEAGAVTVDWVVLTAALVGLGLATMSVVSSGVEDVSSDIDSELNRSDIIKVSFTKLTHLLNDNALNPSEYILFTTPEQVTANRATFEDMTNEQLINAINALSEQGLAAKALVDAGEDDNGVQQGTYNFASDNVLVARTIAQERGIL